MSGSLPSHVLSAVKNPDETHEQSVKKKPTLPFGWIVCLSSTYPDRVYYFNTMTGARTWDLPILCPTTERSSDGKVNYSSFLIPDTNNRSS